MRLHAVQVTETLTAKLYSHPRKDAFLPASFSWEVSFWTEDELKTHVTYSHQSYEKRVLCLGRVPFSGIWSHLPLIFGRGKPVNCNWPQAGEFCGRMVWCRVKREDQERTWKGKERGRVTRKEGSLDARVRQSLD